MCSIYHEYEIMRHSSLVTKTHQRAWDKGHEGGLNRLFQNM